MELKAEERKIVGFLERNPLVVLARICAPSEELVEPRVQMFDELVDILGKLEFNGKKIFKQIAAIVPTNPEYKGKYRLDCGKTIEVLKKYKGSKFVDVIEVKRGGPFARAFNESMVRKLADGYRHAFIFSSEARKCINLETVLANIEAHTKGALYSGVAFDELTPRVYAGHIMNTWACLNIYEALMAGGFNPLAELPSDENFQFNKSAYDRQGVMYSYLVQGCEEGPLIAELFKLYGRPISAAIEPVGEDIKNSVWKYQPMNTPDEIRRHEAKIATKKVRMDSLLCRCGYHPSAIWHALLPEYRKDGYQPM